MNGKKENRLIYILGIALLCFTGISLLIGKYPISLDEIVKILTGRGHEVAGVTYDVFMRLRLPRTLMALMVLFFSKNGHKNSLASIVLSGIVISAMAEAVIMVLKLFADPNRELAPLEYWSMGGLSAITFSKVLWVFPFFAAGMAALFFVRYQITILGLSNEEAAALGVRVGLTRTVILAATTIIVSAIVSVTGLITFIGLVAPHAARMLTQKSNLKTAALACILGGILMIVLLGDFST